MGGSIAFTGVHHNTMMKQYAASALAIGEWNQNERSGNMSDEWKEETGKREVGADGVFTRYKKPKCGPLLTGLRPSEALSTIRENPHYGARALHSSSRR